MFYLEEKSFQTTQIFSNLHDIQNQNKGTILKYYIIMEKA